MSDPTLSSLPRRLPNVGQQHAAAESICAPITTPVTTPPVVSDRFGDAFDEPGTAEGPPTYTAAQMQALADIPDPSVRAEMMLRYRLRSEANAPRDPNAPLFSEEQTILLNQISDPATRAHIAEHQLARIGGAPDTEGYSVAQRAALASLGDPGLRSAVMYLHSAREEAPKATSYTPTQMRLLAGIKDPALRAELELEHSLRAQPPHAP